MPDLSADLSAVRYLSADEIWAMNVGILQRAGWHGVPLQHAGASVCAVTRSWDFESGAQYQQIMVRCLGVTIPIMGMRNSKTGSVSCRTLRRIARAHFPRPRVLRLNTNGGAFDEILAAHDISRWLAGWM
jgi:hypothetical protein